MNGLIPALRRATVPQHWWTIGVIFVSYIAAYELASALSFDPVFLYIPSAISLAALFFAGVELWPFVFIASLSAASLVGFSLPSLALIPIAEALQVGVGALMLRRFNVDPIFRKFKDMLSLMTTVLLVSLIAPTAMLLSDIGVWGTSFVANIFCLLIITPFLLRWCSKRRFSRSAHEVFETVIVFGVLLGIGYVHFITGIESVARIPLVYFLMVPLFWIALRLRPRFVTLAFILTSLIAVYGTFANGQPDELFQLQVFLITIASMFYIIVSLEEDRRLNSNLMRSQLGMLENAVARVSSESKAKNDFIAVLAHELRNPLAPIMSGIDFLKLKGGRDKDETEMLDVMEDRMKMIRHLLDDLLDISRITENKLRLKKDLVDLNEVLRHAALSTEHHRVERHQSLSLKLPKRETTVEGDAVRLEQIFSNLLTNASKYSDPAQPIELTLTHDDLWAQIRIRDRGIGIDPKMLHAIFTPFHQIEAGTRSMKGLGIGLALVRSFVELHGGSVIAESAGTGKGSVFVVTLPLALSSSANNEDNVAASPLSRLKIKRALIVDDNDEAASGIGRLLERQGCFVDFAYDGGQALEKARTSRFDAIILDLDLPDRTGLSVAQALRTRGYVGRLIALTGLSVHDIRRDSAYAGFDAYLEKPTSIAELRAALEG